MKIEAKKSADTLTLKLNGDLDESNAHFVREKTDYLIDNNKITRFVYDFRNLTFMDSSGI